MLVRKKQLFFLIAFICLTMPSTKRFSLQMHMPGASITTEVNRNGQSGDRFGFGINYAYLFSLYVVNTREIGKFPVLNIGPRLDLMNNEAKIGIDVHFFGAAFLGGGVANFITKEYGNNSPYIYAIQPYLLVLGVIYIEWRYELRDQGLKYADQVTLNFRLPIFRSEPDAKSAAAK